MDNTLIIILLIIIIIVLIFIMIHYISDSHKALKYQQGLAEKYWDEARANERELTRLILEEAEYDDDIDNALQNILHNAGGTSSIGILQSIEAIKQVRKDTAKRALEKNLKDI